MPTKIHHGPPGSYKTSGAVWDDAVPAAKAGRLIITNVRGLSADRFLEVFPDLPDSFDIISLDTTTMEGLEKARCWFMWVPKGAFLIFDEAQVLFPKSWTARDLAKFDFPGGADAAAEAGRPADWLTAWTMHRHHNWDIVLTTPNIRMIRDDIRESAECAYRHWNLETLGKFTKWLFRYDYRETQHPSTDNRPANDGTALSAPRKLDKRVWKLYDSTTTGQFTGTFTGKELFASPKILGWFAFLAIVFAVIGYRTEFALLREVASETPVDSVPVAVPASPMAVSSSVSAPASVSPSAKAADDRPKSDVISAGPFAGLPIQIEAVLSSEQKGTMYLFTIKQGDNELRQSSRDLAQIGYAIRPISLCVAELTYQAVSVYAICSGTPPQVAGAAKRLGAERSGTGEPVAAISGERDYVSIVPDTSRDSRPLTPVGSM